MKSGDIVTIKAFDEVPEHLFQIEEVYEDHVTGVALTGPLAGEYGEPSLEMILPAGNSAIPASTGKEIRKSGKTI